MKFQSQRGTNDVLPNKSHQWSQIESKFRETACLFGYSEIRTPTFESTQLFTRTAGETSDLVTKQMYSFKDKGDREITLKPEGTAPVLRAAIEHSLLTQGGITRLFYITPIFRYERPQLGRFREAHQFGLELIGSSSSLADAEIIEVTIRFFESVGLKGLTVMLNSLGRKECRHQYRTALLESVNDFLKTQPEEVQAKAFKNPLRLLDSKDEEVIQAMKSAPSILDFLEPESQQKFNNLQSILNQKNIQFEVRPEIVRGLDYYNETVFEIQSSQLGAQGSLCGGGRYDGLIHELGGPDIPSIGVGIGEERVLIVQEELEINEPHTAADAYLAILGEGNTQYADDLARKLRANGIRTIFDLERKSIKVQLREADRNKVRIVLIVGESERQGQFVTVKEMASGKQFQVKIDLVIEKLRELLN